MSDVIIKQSEEFSSINFVGTFCSVIQLGSPHNFCPVIQLGPPHNSMKLLAFLQQNGNKLAS